MTWMHIAGLAIAAALTIVAALTKTTEAILPVASTIIGGVLGHAMSDRKGAPAAPATPSKKER